MTRGVDAPVLERTGERLNAHPALRQERTHLGERPFGTINHANEQGSFRMQGRKNVRAEFRPSGLAYHLQRVLNSLGVPQRLVALGEAWPRVDVCSRQATRQRHLRCPDGAVAAGHSRSDPTAPQVSVRFHTVWRVVRRWPFLDRNWLYNPTICWILSRVS
jgi:hypothetical protein